MFLGFWTFARTYAPFKAFWGKLCHDSLVEELRRSRKVEINKKRMVRVKYAALTVGLSAA